MCKSRENIYNYHFVLSNVCENTYVFYYVSVCILNISNIYIIYGYIIHSIYLSIHKHTKVVQKVLSLNKKEKL